MKIGYARVSTVDQDLEAQRQQLAALGVDPERVYTDHGLSGRNRERPGLREALAACRAGDELVITKLDRLGRSVRDLAEISDDLTTRGVVLNVGGSINDPSSPTGKLMFNVLSMIAEFEADLIKARTIEGLEIARQRGRLVGKKPKLSPRREAALVRLYTDGSSTIADLTDTFGVGRSTVYRALARAGVQPGATAR